MKLIVGLGNPGLQYDKTRHNAGFLVVDALASRHAGGQIPKSRFNSITLDAFIGAEKVLLMKPTTFMNLSGKAVGEAVRFYKLDPSEDLIVIVDDIALPVGHTRVRKNGGSGGHNGLSDIDRLLGSDQYMRVRLGVGEVPKLMNQSDWVLSRFMSEEREDIERGIVRAADAVECIIDEGVVKAMNSFNTKLKKPKPERVKDDQQTSADSQNNDTEINDSPKG
ncbi:MAG: aminoacyl-tRNA hydrolase [Phycisphaerae bacterium]|nr:aminoacyl-tRNA hydrolase [Phycisphaerae bacterium]MBM91189.1 aminoacyl-tRNA hydrolase [Phycisphaerae bacterium]HCT45355.1 aminoacyl-tRNA hydrolase [Phycisphaerales bacterium]